MRGCYNGDWVSEWAAQWRRKYGLILFFFFPDFLPFYVFVSSSQTPTRTIKTNKTKQTNILKLPFVEAKRASNHTLLFPSPQSKQFFKIHVNLFYFLWFHCSRLDWIQIQFLWSQYNNNNNNNNTQHKKKKKGDKRQNNPQKDQKQTHMTHAV